MDWLQGRYIYGLNVGKPKDDIQFRIEDGRLEVKSLRPSWLGGWNTSVPLSEITSAEIVDADRISGMRVVMTGGIGLFWKKTDRFLVMNRSFGTMQSQVTISASWDNLNKALSAIGVDSLRSSGAAFELHLLAVGPNKISVIKAVQEACGLGLASAKKLVESAPKYVTATSSEAAARDIATRLEKAGATVEVRAPSPAGSSVDPASALERLEDLRSRGLVTEDEFKAKRADILARL